MTLTFKLSPSTREQPRVQGRAAGRDAAAATCHAGAAERLLRHAGGGSCGPAGHVRNESEKSHAVNKRTHKHNTLISFQQSSRTPLSLPPPSFLPFLSTPSGERRTLCVPNTRQRADPHLLTLSRAQETRHFALAVQEAEEPERGPHYFFRRRLCNEQAGRPDVASWPRALRCGDSCCWSKPREAGRRRPRANLQEGGIVPRQKGGVVS